MDGGFRRGPPLRQSSRLAGIPFQSCLFASPPRGDFALSRMKGVAIQTRCRYLPPSAVTKTDVRVCWTTLERFPPPGNRGSQENRENLTHLLSTAESNSTNSDDFPSVRLPIYVETQLSESRRLATGEVMKSCAAWTILAILPIFVASAPPAEQNRKTPSPLDLQGKAPLGNSGKGNAGVSQAFQPDNRHNISQPGKADLPMTREVGGEVQTLQPEKFSTFDPHSLRIERRDRRWTLEVNQLVLKDCGERQEEARQTWNLIRQLQLDQRCVLGGSKPVVEYWLTRGKPPSVLPRGLRSIPVNLDQLRLEKSQGFWVLREDHRVLFNFGSEEAEARQALAVFQKYRFTRIAVIGQAAPAMMIPVAEGENPSPLRKQELADKKDDQTLLQTSGKQSAPTFYPTPIVPPLRNGANKWTSPGNLPASLVDVTERQITFDPRLAQVQKRDTEWVLTVGEHTLGRFGQSERHARLALAAFSHYRLTEVRQIGDPNPVASYYLSSGRAPRGLMPGQLGDRFDAEQLLIRQIGEKHYLCQRGRPLLECGPRLEDAQHMLRVLRQHHFDHVLRFGPNDQTGMMLFVQGR